MKTIKLYNGNDASESQISETVRDLAEGKTIIWPTDTLYGIACDALQPKAIERICRLKGINPERTNLSIVCSSIQMAAEYARIDNAAFRLVKELVPGPYTFLFRSASTLPRAFKGRKTVGVRIPDNDLCREIVERLGHPVLTTSIEYDDEDYARNPELINEAYENRVDTIIEGAEGGVEPSTIIDLTGNEPEVVRQGAGPVDLD